MILEHSNKLQDLETQLEKEKRVYHDLNLEITALNEKLQNQKHENLILSSKVEELSFREIESQEKLQKIQESYESQVENLSASQQETKSKWKDKYKGVSKELEIANDRIAELEEQLEQLNASYNQSLAQIEDEKAALADSDALVSQLRSRVQDLETGLTEKTKLAKQQKDMICRLAAEKEELGLELEKQHKLNEVEVGERNAKITHLQTMMERYKNVIEKVDQNLKQLPQEFAIKLMSVEKKLKREKESKLKAQDEVKRLKRELLEKESQWKRQFATVKNQELKAFAEWDMNSFHTQTDDPKFRKSFIN